MTVYEQFKKLKSNASQLPIILEERMLELADRENYELAAKHRDLINIINDSNYGIKKHPYWVEYEKSQQIKFIK